MTIIEEDLAALRAFAMEILSKKYVDIRLAIDLISLGQKYGLLDDKTSDSTERLTGKSE